MIPTQLYPSAVLHGRVAHEIGRKIASGQIAEGEALPREAELAARYGVSRQAIREALKVLAAKGLIHTRRRAGTFITSRCNWNLLDPDVLAWHSPAALSPDFLADLIELRLLIEPGAAALAATRGKPENIARIRAALRAMHEAQTEPARYAADVEFHVAIFAASGNVLIDRLSRILAPLLEASFREQGNLAASIEEALAQHDAIYEGIAAGDPVRARQAMEKTLGVAHTGIRRIKSRQAGSPDQT